MNSEIRFEYKIDHLRDTTIEYLVNTLTLIVNKGFLTQDQVLSKIKSDGFSEEQIEAFKRSQDKLIYLF